MKKLNIKTSVVFRVAIGLLCVLFIMTYALSAIYARYTARSSDSSNANVVKFDVQVTGDADVSADVTQTVGEAYTVTIDNNSDLSVRYTLSVTDIPGVNITFDRSSGVLQPGADNFLCNLTFEVTDWDLITADMEGSADSKTFNFTITVNVEQLD